jgi:hypothetical protein
MYGSTWLILSSLILFFSASLAANIWDTSAPPAGTFFFRSLPPFFFSSKIKHQITFKNSVSKGIIYE